MLQPGHPARTGMGQPKRRYQHEEVSRMAGRATAAAMRRLMAERQERRHRLVEAESVAEGFRREQELEQEAPEAGHADREAVEAGSTGQAATV